MKHWQLTPKAKKNQLRHADGDIHQLSMTLTAAGLGLEIVPDPGVEAANMASSLTSRCTSVRIIAQLLRVSPGYQYCMRCAISQSAKQEAEGDDPHLCCRVVECPVRLRLPRETLNPRLPFRTCLCEALPSDDNNKHCNIT